MNTSVPRGSRDDLSRETAGSAGRPIGDWLDDLVAAGARPRDVAPSDDHRDGMRAIADQLARIDAPAQRGAGFSSAALRDAVADITRRQAMLDDEPAGQDEAARRGADALAPAAQVASEAPRAEASAPALDTRQPPVPPHPAAPVEAPMAPAPSREAGERFSNFPAPSRNAIADRSLGAPWTPERSGLRRAGIDLSAEVSQTFARFSRDMLDAIHSSDVRPEIEALDRQVRTIGRTLDGLGEDLRGPRPAPAPTPELAGALEEMRGLFDSFKPGATLSAIETRIDGLAKRLDRDNGDPAALIEGLSRRVDEIHHSLRSQVAQSAVDAGSLESLVRGISDRIGQARAHSADFEQLELAMRDVAARIDRVPAGTDSGGMKSLEGQIAKIGERLDRSEASLRAIDGVEHSLGELFSQFEVTRQVAIDAAETAARTAARDTLRAALQSPGLQQRAPELSSGLADQMARGIEDLRAMQEIAQRRTQDALSQIHDAMERLARHMAGNDGSRTSAARDARRPEGERSRVGDLPRATPLPDVDTPIEPGYGRTGALRTEPRFAAEPASEPALPPPAEPLAPTPVEGDGPATFIAAARRAAAAAQASAASTAALKAAERRPVSPRARSAKSAPSGGPATVGRTRAFLEKRQRPLLLGLAALVMLVGALEVVNLGLGGSSADRVAGSVETERQKARVADMAVSTPDLPAPATPVTAAPAPAKLAAAMPAPPLPTLLGGPASQTQAPSAGIPNGLKTLASSGDAAAQYEVGLRYADGHGVPRDPKEAAAWLTKAAVQGLAPAEYRLGSAYEKGIGTDRDPTLAMSWYGKAAEAGNVKAMHNLAVMAAEGAAGKPDYAKAANWFQKASSYGVRDSEFNLAILYARGLGIEQSLPKSYMWFAVAASAGDEDSAKKRDEVGAKLDPTALASAKAAADAFKPATPPASANEVPAPPGGWDAVGSKAAGTSAERVSRL